MRSGSHLIEARWKSWRDGDETVIAQKLSLHRGGDRMKMGNVQDMSEDEQTNGLRHIDQAVLAEIENFGSGRLRYRTFTRPV